MKEKIKSKYGLMKALLVILAVVIVGVIYSCTVRNAADNSEDNVVKASDNMVISASLTDEVIAESEDIIEDSTSTMVCVHICGAVVNPGVYFLEEGSRIHQAVDMAGGLREDASNEYINLASVIADGSQIYFPTVQEVESGDLPEIQTVPIVDDGLININTAGINELMTLPGIGESKAAAIISYRENVAPFDTIEDITNVEGIKDSSFDKLKDYIKVK